MKILRLIKLKICGLACLASLTGAIAAGCDAWFQLFSLCLATFFLAAGSAALNQVQEWRLDGRMDRTCQRLIPSGQLSPRQALGIALLLIAMGMAGMIIFFGPQPACWGGVVISLYNGVYTLLKLRTKWASILGALSGACLPVVGWSAAGANLSNRSLHYLMAFIFLWQIPHFWLVMILYRKDYRRANIPGLLDAFPGQPAFLVVFAWMVNSLCLGIFFPFTYLLHHLAPLLSLVIGAVFIVGYGLKLILRNTLTFAKLSSLFRLFNIYAAWAMISVSVDQLLFVGK